jgi:hypothetical protein
MPTDKIDYLLLILIFVFVALAFVFYELGRAGG